MSPTRRAGGHGGFTLVEVLVAALVGLLVLAAGGQLGLNIFHQRASYDSISAATSLAERQFELLRDIQSPSSDSNFTTGSHTATNSPMKQDGTSGGPYNVTWTVVDNTPMTGVKKITVNVTHTSDPSVNVQLITYYKTS